MPFFAIALPIFLFFTLWGVFYSMSYGLVRLVKRDAQKVSVFVISGWLDKWAIAYPRWTGIRPYLPMIFIFIVGGLLAFGTGFVFTELARSFSRTTSQVYLTDEAVNVWFQTERFPSFTLLFVAVTNFGGAIGMATVVVLVGTGLSLRKEYASTLFLVITAAGGGLLNLGLKLQYVRARPDIKTAIAVAQGLSFPSGHAMASFIILGSIGYLMIREPIPWKFKSAIMALLVTLIILVGLSRVYLGVHWSSDIAAAWSVGIVWLAGVIIAFEIFLRIRLLRRGKILPPPGVTVPDKPAETPDTAAKAPIVQP